MRQYDVHLEKTRKSLLAVALLQAGRSSRASFRADSQTPGSLPCVGIAAAGRRRPTPGRAGARLKADGDASRIMLLLTEKVAREVVEAIDANTEALKRLEGKIDSKADA